MRLVTNSTVYRKNAGSCLDHFFPLTPSNSPKLKRKMESFGILDRPLTHGFPSLDPDSPDYALRAHTLPSNITGVRQLVINKQNGRVVAAKSQLVGRMEDALIRWRPPVSCHAGSTAALKGKHPYQLEVDTTALRNSQAHTSLDSIRQCFEALSNAVSRPRTEKSDMHNHPEATSLFHSVNLGDSANSSQSSSASGMLQEIRQSLQSAETRGLTPRAIVCEQELETHSIEPISYSFPIPAYYLPQQVPRPVEESTRDNVNENEGEGEGPVQTYWGNFWNQFCRECKLLCACV
ncbi:LAME_0B05996g1_1 [Lachancea meyersii CBS 8951]|uniref:LAME_0B05996g1_1 n=1 Tax=Lachancea meyersii CBS 8951 TaxID=1266667 RepID=A0A1G4IWK0_9SACH|nr:LAME_0B05996g1_1 [Lachancea meyersii CBS 8951]